MDSYRLGAVGVISPSGRFRGTPSPIRIYTQTKRPRDFRQFGFDRLGCDKCAVRGEPLSSPAPFVQNWSPSDGNLIAGLRSMGPLTEGLA